MEKLKSIVIIVIVLVGLIIWGFLSNLNLENMMIFKRQFKKESLIK
ncbi:hypothetical protein IM538_13595 [Cytobacillus suaedae]|nr:hypothetical protein IM538_13595 [Cytobacillus suaedae]